MKTAYMMISAHYGMAGSQYEVEALQEIGALQERFRSARNITQFVQIAKEDGQHEDYEDIAEVCGKQGRLLMLLVTRGDRSGAMKIMCCSFFIARDQQMWHVLHHTLRYASQWYWY